MTRGETEEVLIINNTLYGNLRRKIFRADTPVKRDTVLELLNTLHSVAAGYFAGRVTIEVVRTKTLIARDIASDLDF